MAPLPIAKLASLLIKTLAKPMAKKIKVECSRYETTQNILVIIGQATHSATSRLTIWSQGYTVRSINPLERDVAANQGAEFVGEAFIFGVGGGLVVWEYNKKAKEDELKKAVASKKMKNLDARIGALEERIKDVELAAKVLRQKTDRDRPGQSERRWWNF